MSYRRTNDGPGQEVEGSTAGATSRRDHGQGRPLLADLYCCAGGAAEGYHRAGFDIVGVDIRPQPHYPFEFVQADAMTFPLDGFAAIHASPPCQDHMRSGMHPLHGTGWLLNATRTRLTCLDVPWVIENVPGAPMRADYKLCGCMFGLEVRRERWFETSWGGFDMRPPCHHAQPAVGVYGHPRGRRSKDGKPWGWGNYEDWVRAMGIDWMSGPELAQAIPPAYTEYIGRQLLEECRRVNVISAH